MQTNEILTLKTQEVSAGFNPLFLEKAKQSMTNKAEVLPVNLSMKNWATDKITEFKRAVFLGIEKMNCLNEKTGEIEGRDAAIFMDEKSNIYYKVAYQFVKAVRNLPLYANFSAKFAGIEKIGNGNKAETFIVNLYKEVK